METSKIEIFESISLLSNLMPYYGSSHEGFLLLSMLSRSIRNYLLEHYQEYRTFMLKYAKKIDYVKGGLPLDLFKFSELYVYYEEVVEILVGLISTSFKLTLF